MQKAEERVALAMAKIGEAKGLKLHRRTVNMDQACALALNVGPTMPINCSLKRRSIRIS
jgi:hypothetical protein